MAKETTYFTMRGRERIYVYCKKHGTVPFNAKRTYQYGTFDGYQGYGWC